MADSSRLSANMEVVLDGLCKELPHGGDHEYRKFIAERLKESVASGKTNLRDLYAAAHSGERDSRAAKALDVYIG